MKKSPLSRRPTPAPPAAYAAAGVDIALGNRLKRGIQARVRSTHGPEVLSPIGGFGGLFRGKFPGMKDPVLVSSIDGVGTKLKVAFLAGRHHTVGQDLVNHCVNDIAVTGAKPLFFLDYLATGKLEPAVFGQLLSGLARACRLAGCALIGGETAQMSDLYQPGEYDLAGCIVGVVDRARMLDGSRIRPGDVAVGLPSSGLHTNGYSLARRILFGELGLKPADPLPGGGGSVADALLRVHRNYQPLMAGLPAGSLKGAAHITGGGLVDNPPRILPADCDLALDRSRWKVPPIFRLLQEAGNVSDAEMHQVFNMGIGMVLVVAGKDAARICRLTRGREIGRIVRGSRRVLL